MEASQDHSPKSSNSGPRTMSNAEKKNTTSKNTHPLATGKTSACARSAQQALAIVGYLSACLHVSSG
jgi:hypothetical protein